MQRVASLAGTFLAVLLFGAPCLAVDEMATKEEAVAMVRRVQEKFAKDGPEATFIAVTDQSNKEFHDRDLYPFIYDLSGLNVAHRARPMLVGRNLISATDREGRMLVREMIAIATSAGSGWIDYKSPNPLTNVIEDKSTYIEKMGNYFVGVGIHRSPR